MMPALLLPVVSHATTVQPAPAPSPAPGGGGVAGPPDGGIPPAPIDRGGRQIPPPVIVTPPPTGPAPFPLPTRPSPTPAPAPTVTPGSPVPRQAQPAPRPVPRTSGPIVRSPAATPTPTPQPDGVLPIPVDPALLPDSAAPQDAVPTDPIATPDTVTAAGDDGLAAWWPWIAGGGIALALLIGWLFGRRRRPTVSRDDHQAHAADAAVTNDRPQNAERPVVSPRPAAKTSPPKTITIKPAAQPAPAASPIPRRDFAPRLGLNLTPVSVSTTLVNMRLRYVVDVTNLSDGAISGGKCRVQLLSGPQAAEAVIRSWFGSDSAHVVLDVPALAPGESAQITGEMAVPLGGLHPITVEGRMLVVPVIGLVAQFTHATGLGQVARAFVIGRDPGGPGNKLAPFQLDRGPANFTPLGARDTGIADSD